jgi:hypothetical protein
MTMQYRCKILSRKRIRSDCSYFVCYSIKIYCSYFWSFVGARSVALVDSTGALTGTWNRPAGTPGPITTTVTTSTNHGLTTGDRVAIDFSGSLMRDGVYDVTVTGDLHTFTVQSLTTGVASGTCTIFTED